MKTLSVRWGALLALATGFVPACGSDTDDAKDDSADAGDDGPTRDNLACKVAIVGGGAAGLHTAFRLAPKLGDGVCLFEKGTELGGRIHDVALDEDDPDSPRFGTGALRVMEGQTVLFGLADELEIELETPDLTSDLINARGTFAFAKDDFVPAYPTMTPKTNPDTDQESWLYDELRFGPSRDTITEYSDFRAYTQAVAGAEGYRFLHDMSRFRADFEYPLDARGYLDYLDEEWDVCCTPSYPVGGMSRFIHGMQTSADKNDARIFTDDAVAGINRAGDGYVLTTAQHEVTADKVVIAVPPSAFQYIDGEVAQEIKKQAEFQDIIGVRVVTVTQWWDERWWADIANPDATAGGQVWRAWTTDHCVNFIEVPLASYGIDQKVTRSVYDDDLNCVQFWEELAKQGTDAVEQEIQRGLEFLFDNNGKTTPAAVNVPKAVKTHVQVWPDAWHWLRAGTSLTNQDIFDWAIEPLDGEPVALVGEAYNPQRSGWSDGAYKSSIHLLNEKYGMDLPGLEKPTPRHAVRRARNLRGH